MENDEGPLVIGFHGLGEEAIEREWLVLAARHEAFDHIAALEIVWADLLHRQTPHDQRIEAVEGAEDAPDQPSAFGWVGVEIGEMRESGAYGWRAMHGDGVALRCH